MSQEPNQRPWPLPPDQVGPGGQPPAFTPQPPSGMVPGRPPVQQQQGGRRKSTRLDRAGQSQMTLFRTGNFFVHAFSPRLRTGSLARTGAEGTVLERVRWMSAEKQRLLAAQTRLLPQVDTFNTSQWREFPVPGWLEGLFVALLLGVLLFFQAINLFHQSYTTDEGTLMANAWAMLQGKIAPYVYTYDHPPLGWVLIAGWLRLTGGIGSFGDAVNSGRVLMLVLSAASSLMLYLIASRLSGSRSAALLAMILYTISPLSILYHNQVLLNNIATFWLLLSLCLITTGKSRLGTFALAAAMLGIAVMSEGLFLAFLPVMLYAVTLHSTKFQRKFSLVAFAYITLAIASAYVLLALLKGELLPTVDPLAHPSLLGTFLQKTHNPLADQQSLATAQDWLNADWLFLLIGTVAIGLNILGGTVNRFQLLAALCGVTYLLVLVIDTVWYPTSIVPLLPFLALNVAAAVNTPLRWLTRHIGFDLLRILLLFVLIGLLVPFGLQQTQPLLAADTAQPQQQAMVWVRANVPHNAVVITNSYMYADLQDPQGLAVSGGAPFTNAEIYTNAALDPAISAGKLHDNWQKISYLVLDSSMLKLIQTNRDYSLLNEAFHHALQRTSFGSEKDGTQILIYQVIVQP